MQIFTLDEWIAKHDSLTKAATDLNVGKQTLNYALHHVKGRTLVLKEGEDLTLLREVPKLKKAP